MATGFSVFVTIGGKVGPSLGAAIRAVDAQFVGLANRLKGIGASVDAPFRKIDQGLKRTQRALERVQNRGRDLTLGLTAPAGFAAKRGFDMVLDFEREMNRIQAYGELTDEQRLRLEKLAREIGRDTGHTAKQAAEMERAYIQAGRSVEQVLGMTRPTLDFARFGGIDPKAAADIVTSVTSAYRVPMETIEQAKEAAAHVGDVIAKGANISRADPYDFAQAFKYAAPIAARLGVTMEQLAAAVATMNQNGLRGDEAGVAIRSMLVRMIKPTLGARAALAALNLEFEDFGTRFKQVDVDGFGKYLDQKGIDATSVLPKLKARLDGKQLGAENHGEIAKILRDTVIKELGITKPRDQKEVANAVNNYIAGLVEEIDFDKLNEELTKRGATPGQIAQIFDQRQGARIATLLGEMQKDGTIKESQYNEFLKILIEQSRGSSYRGARLMEKGAPGAVDRFTSSVSDLVINIAKSGVLDDVTDGLNRMSDAVNRLAETDPGKLKLAVYLAAAAAAAGPALLVIGGLGRAALFASRGVFALARGVAFLATAMTAGLAGRLMLLSRGIGALAVATGAGLASRVRSLAGALVMLSAVGGSRAVLGAMAGGLLALGRSVLMFPVAALAAIGRAMWLLVANPVGIAITAVLTALTALGLWVYNNWEGIKTGLEAFGKAFMDNLGPGAKGAVDGLVSAFETVKGWVMDLLGPIDNMNERFGSWGAAAGKAAAEIVNALVALPGQIASQAVAFASSLTKLAQDGYNAVTGFDWGGLGRSIVQAIIDGLSSMASAFIGRLRAMASQGAAAVRGLFSSGSSGGQAAGSSPATVAPEGRAIGGPVVAGVPYIVGERGPELFIPGASGAIATNSAYRSIAAAGSSPATGSIANAMRPVSYPSAKDVSEAAAAGRNGKSVTIGDSHVSVSVQAGGANAGEIARQVRDEVRKVIARLQAEQRSYLSD
jgi:hypothetical protein